jgi:hypothetical protein
MASNKGNVSGILLILLGFVIGSLILALKRYADVIKN